MLAWKLRSTRFVGIEAQEVSFGLVQKNVTRNSVGNRVELRYGDFREPAIMKGIEPAGLISCTPPYVPVGRGTPSPDSQRAYARQEMRGGVEDYLRTARSIVKQAGMIVTCADARYPERVTTTAHELGLTIHDYRPVVPRAECDPLFTVWTLSPTKSSVEPSGLPIVVRDKDGIRTPLAREIREFFGLPSEQRASAVS